MQTSLLQNDFDPHTQWQQKSAVKLKAIESKSLADWLVSKLAASLEIKPESIDVNQVFSVYGLSSRLAVSLVGELEDFLATAGNILELSPTLLWQYQALPR